jgi:hypothetical protein
MSEAELRDLGEDIKKNGLTSAIVLFRELVNPADPNGGRKYRLLDGISRLDAMELAGVPFSLHQGSSGKFGWSLGNVELPDPVIVEGIDPYTYVLSVNVHRRHLTTEQRLQLVDAVVKARPELPSNQVAKLTAVSPNTVLKRRMKLETAGDVCTVQTSIDTRGRRQPTRKPRKTEGRIQTRGRPAGPTPKQARDTFRGAPVPAPAADSNGAEHNANDANADGQQDDYFNNRIADVVTKLKDSSPNTLIKEVCRGGAIKLRYGPAVVEQAAETLTEFAKLYRRFWEEARS